MSDFDAVLERLVTDPGFTSALAADPARALAGYHLTPDEVDLLRSQVSAGDAGGRAVETRTSKAGMAGLFGGLGAGWVGPGDAGMGGAGTSGFADVNGPVNSGFADLGGHYGPPAGGAESVGAALHGAADVGGHYGPPAGAMPTMDSVVGPGDHLATGYHHHIDADGDGHWDRYTAVRHADGSVDVYEDRNGDGVVDFIGHDRNGDGILESADYDEDFNGVADTRMTDVNGDGWMDTRTRENY